jgi:hypothetical protein
LSQSIIAVLGIALHLAVQIAMIVRVLLRAHRDPASRIAWVLVIAASRARTVTRWCGRSDFIRISRRLKDKSSWTIAPPG